MEYVSFTVIVAASGALIAWLWYRSYRAGIQARRFGGGYVSRNGLPDEPIPPFKRTVSGPTEADAAQLQFNQRIDVWQRDYEARRLQFNNNAQSLQGMKYNFVPRKRNGEPISNSA